MIFFHGGGLVAGSLETHEVVCRGLCAASRCCVIAVDYRLAPEHPYPAALEDAVAATAEIRRRAAALAIDPARLGLVGESGGAVLAIGAAHRLGPGTSALLCLICPPVDFSMSSPSWQAFGSGYLLDRETLEADLADVTQGLITAGDARLSPIHLTGLARLPRTIVHTAEFDPLRDEGAAFCVLLRAAGVEVTHHMHQGLLHSFHAMGAVVPRGAEALAEMGAEIGSALQTRRA
jgi:acetyl esterase/lipase